MRTGMITTTMILTIMCAGCGTRSLYETLRIQQEMQCQKLERSDQEACLKRSGMSYDEYQRQMKEREKEK